MARHILISSAGAGMYLPYAKSMLAALRRTKLYAASSWKGVADYLIHAEICGDQEFITIEDSDASFEFFSPRFQNTSWASTTTPPDGYITRVLKNGRRVSVAHSDANLNAEVYGTALTPNDLWRRFSYVHDPQMQAINQYQFWPDRAGPTCLLHTWHRDLQLPDCEVYGYVGTHDVGFDLAPTVSRRAGVLSTSEHGVAPDTDWYRQAGYANGIVYMVSAECKLYAYRPALNPDNPDTTPPNITDFQVIDLRDVLPPTVDFPTGQLRNANPLLPSTHPDYRWAWRSDCKRLASIVNIDSLYYDLTMLVEVELETMVAEDNTFTIRATLVQALRSGLDSDRYYLGAEYAYNVSGAGHKNPEPLRVMYSQYAWTMNPGYSSAVTLYVADEGSQEPIFQLLLREDSGDMIARARIIAVDLRSLSFVVSTHVEDTGKNQYSANSWKEAVLLYSFGVFHRTESHGFFGYSSDEADSVFTADRASGMDVYLPDESVQQTIVDYTDELHPSTAATKGEFWPTARTSFQVHPRGHFSICVGPFVSGDTALPDQGHSNAVNIEQFYLDVIGFRLRNGRYVYHKHLEARNDAFGLNDSVEDYHVKTNQFNYSETLCVGANPISILEYSHDTNPNEIRYRSFELPSNTLQSMLTIFGLSAFTYKCAQDPTITPTELANIGAYDIAYNFHLPYIRGDSQFVGVA